jgi:hypothetical protein
MTIIALYRWDIGVRLREYGGMKAVAIVWGLLIIVF